jgi:hypothetical protein
LAKREAGQKQGGQGGASFGGCFPHEKLRELKFRLKVYCDPFIDSQDKPLMQVT